MPANKTRKGAFNRCGVSALSNVLSTRIWPIGALLNCTPMHLNDGKGTSVLCDWLLVSLRSRGPSNLQQTTRTRCGEDSSANVQSIYQHVTPDFLPTSPNVGQRGESQPRRFFDVSLSSKQRFGRNYPQVSSLRCFI